MKWFRHHSDSYSNLKMQEILSRDDRLQLYATFWLACELVANQGEEYSLNGDKAWKRALMRITGLTEKKLDEYLQFFADLRLISGDDLKKGKLSIPKMADYSDDYTNKVRRVSGQYTENVPLDKIRRDKNRLDKNIDLFDRFWQSYPRKTAKQAALRAWAKLSPDPKLFEAILAGVDAWKKSSQWTKDGGEYIPHPASFLNGRRWEDEVPKSGIKSLKID